MFVSILAITLGLIFWICFILTTVFLDCRLPDEFWSNKHTEVISVQVMFSIAFCLLFILNFSIYITGKKSSNYRENFVTGTLCIVNAVLITTIGLVLLQQVWFNHQNRELRQIQVAERNFSKGRCVQLEPFLGKWKIIGSNSLSSHFKDYILFSDDLEIRTNNKNFDSYYYRISFFDKFTVTPESHRDLVPKKFTNSKTLRGILYLDYDYCDKKICQWHENHWYFEVLADELVFIKAEINTQGQENEWLLNDELIKMHRVGE